MVSGADRLRQDALANAMMRMQFGKSIASVQSMKHKQADMLWPPRRHPRHPTRSETALRRDQDGG